MQATSTYVLNCWHKSIPLLFLFLVSPSFADNSVSFSGRLDVLGVQALNSESVSEDPSITGRVKLDTTGSPWRFHSWLEGGWDGTVKKPPRDESLFKNYDKVYQSNTPYLEFKELYGTYSANNLEFRAGIQRYAWGRLDEYPPNDLLNPWDYTRFLRKPLEDRKIGVPSISASLNKGEWTYDAVWIPVFVPYRLAMPDERWAGIPSISTFLQIPGIQITPDEPDLPRHTFENSTLGLRIKRPGDIEWSFNFLHGYDPRPVFKTTALTIVQQGSKVLVDPGYVPDFHSITVIGFDAAAVRGDLSLRAEAAYDFNRYLNISRDRWGYPAIPLPGIYPLNPAEQQHDTLDYGIGADYRTFEDGLLTIQAQQTITFGNVDLLYESQVETLLWFNFKIGWLNQKLETNLNLAYNPEHGDTMTKADAWYVFTDSLKGGVTAVFLDGPPQSIFGRFARNDQVEIEVRYSW